MARGLFITALAPLVVAGCGGSGATSTVTVTSQPSAPATSAEPSPGAQLRAYIDLMHKAKQQWEHANAMWTRRRSVSREARTTLV
jgi:hypothetical protein